MVPESFVQELLGRVDIVEVISRHVPLKRAGANNYSARCPFHEEKTPSFTVSVAKQFYHCFGCGAHGTAIGFLMQHRNLSFPEAVEELAAQAGLTVPRSGGRGRDEGYGKLFEVLAQAQGWYRRSLDHSEAARDYLGRRGLDAGVLEAYGLGWSGSGWRNLAAVFADYGQNAALVAAGLVLEGEDKRRYDRFRDRVMLPILDGRGRTIGFGGRVLGQGEPKYLNSPETPVFSKGRELYGFSQARQAIAKEGKGIVVEGYMDVIALAQHGIGNAVATLGTATTSEQVRRLFRATEDVVFCFDGDLAGRRAAWRALTNGLAELVDGKSIRFVFLPEGEDPDSFVRKAGSDAFRRLVDRGMPLSDFMVQGLTENVDLGQDEGRAKFLHHARPLLERLSAPALGALLRRRLAQAIGLGERDLDRILDRRSPLPSLKSRAARQAPVLVDRVLELSLLNPEGLRGVDLTGLDGEDGPVALVREVAAYVEAREAPVTTALVLQGMGEALGGYWGRVGGALAAEELSADEVGAELGDALARLRQELARQKTKELLGSFHKREASPSAMTSDEREAYLAALYRRQP